MKIWPRTEVCLSLRRAISFSETVRSSTRRNTTVIMADYDDIVLIDIVHARVNILCIISGGYGFSGADA
jgi:hypothetical protein